MGKSRMERAARVKELGPPLGSLCNHFFIACDIPLCEIAFFSKNCRMEAWA